MFHGHKLRIDPPWLRPASWAAGLLAIALVVVATLLRLALAPLNLAMPFVTFYPAVILAALLGGTVSGLLAMLLGMLSAWWFVVPPGFALGIEQLGLPNPLILFTLVAVTNVGVIGGLQATMARRRDRVAMETARNADASQRLADALHNAAFGVVIVDARTNMIQFANPAYATLRGTTVDQLQQTNILDAYAPAERTRVQALLDTADRTGRVAVEAAYNRADGSVVPVQIDITSVSGPTGEVLYRVGTARDIVERKYAEAMTAELHALDERLWQILDETPVAMVLRSAEDARYVWVNATTCRMLESTAEELVGRYVDDFRHPADGATPIAEPRGAVPEWDPHDRRLIAKSGRIVRVRTRSVRLGPDATGQDLILGLAEDITRQRQVEAELRQAQKMEAIGNLAGGVAHDFNNLLGVIIGNLDTIATLTTQDPDVTSLLKDATDAALRGAALTRDLLAFARRQPLRPVELAVNTVITDLARLLARVLRQDIVVTLDLAPTVWPVIADRAMLESSLLNLASNARDAMPRGGTLRISTANRVVAVADASPRENPCPGDYVTIEVADTGVGIAPETLDRIFEPFFTTKPMDQGSGLGLSMAFGFISQSGGHISVESERGVGTTFRLLLPRAAVASPVPEPEPEPEREPEPAAVPVSEPAPGVVPEPVSKPRLLPAPMLTATASSPQGGHGGVVLVVEDNAALRRVVVRQLARLGYAVIEADNADTALRLLRDTKVQVLFTDVLMPGGLDGLELARQARVVQPGIKVLLTSGFSEHDAAPSAERTARDIGTRTNASEAASRDDGTAGLAVGGGGHADGSDRASECGADPAADLASGGDRLLRKPYRAEDLAREMLTVLLG